MITTTIKEKFENREFDKVLKEVYLDADRLDGQRLAEIIQITRMAEF